MLINFQKETPSDVRLHLAAVNGDLKVIRRLLDSGKVHVDCRDKVFYNLHWTNNKVVYV